MKTNNYLNELKDIQNVTSRIKQMNESLNFDDEFDFEDEIGDGETPVEAPQEMPACNCANGECTCDEDLENEIDTIREIALKGMIKLCKTPEDEKYQFLKKIFSFCDKASENKNEETEK